jgi:hypothetical protein
MNLYDLFGYLTCIWIPFEFIDDIKNRPIWYDVKKCYDIVTYRFLNVINKNYNHSFDGKPIILRFNPKLCEIMYNVI